MPPPPHRPESEEKEGAAKRKAAPRGATGVQLGEDTARSRVLQGAARVFAERGARLASVEDILEASGISRRTFYRFYEGKEHVMLALYNVGTEGLLTACKLATANAKDPTLVFERCIDAHLMNARMLPRLVFVLGGEAQHHESPLHARRMQVHSELVALFTQDESGSAVDELTVRTLILALEAIVRFTLQTGDEGRNLSEERLAHAKRVMMQLCAAAMTRALPR